MTHGLKILASDGVTVEFDSSSKGGVFIGKVTIPSDTDGWITYDGASYLNGVLLPNLYNRTLFWVTLINGDQNWYIDNQVVYDPAGPAFYPRIKYVQRNTNTIVGPGSRNTSLILVFAK